MLVVAMTMNMLSTTTPYWFDRRIHNLGNAGFPGGVVHALAAPCITRFIDERAYGGRDVRAELLREHIVDDDERVIDLCCGTGMSTWDVGVDTSPQMIEVARRLHAGERREGGGGQREYHVGNAETWSDDEGFDVVTLMFALHEMPADGRAAVVANAQRLARRRVLVVDIAPHYAPSAIMLAGEPYVTDYLDKVEGELGNGWEHTVVAGTVGVWWWDQRGCQQTTTVKSESSQR